MPKGTTIVPMNADVFASPAPILATGSHTVVLVTTDPANSKNVVALPLGSEIGDTLEVYMSAPPGHGAGGDVTTQSGETLHGIGGTIVQIKAGAFFRKVSDTDWVTLGNLSS